MLASQVKPHHQQKKMVRAAFTTFVLLAVCRAVGASPTTDTTFVTSTFSFAEWVEGIIADPQGNHLTAKQAIAAFYAGRNNTVFSENVRRGPLLKRASCNEQPNTEVPVGDAVSCINYLAAKGQTACVVNDYSRFCESGQALMDGNSGSPTSSAWEELPG
ncbi:hypothetical protein B0J18DRAFT_441990 [Chaetomium sp. MPI-SDFR-AT-0129]|nr:hypothetical protein B0J18DRAFT_441990 [Chaetomium sp. MPI-SDFR-AT-0129]